MLVDELKQGEFSISENPIPAQNHSVTFLTGPGNQVTMNLQMTFDARDIGQFGPPLSYDCGVFHGGALLNTSGKIFVDFTNAETVILKVHLETTAPKGRLGN